MKNKANSEKLLQDMLNIIRNHPGIRASEINKELGRKHTNYYRQKLINRNLVRKIKLKKAVRYYIKTRD